MARVLEESQSEVRDVWLPAASPVAHDLRAHEARLPVGPHTRRDVLQGEARHLRAVEVGPRRGQDLGGLHKHDGAVVDLVAGKGERLAGLLRSPLLVHKGGVDQHGVQEVPMPARAMRSLHLKLPPAPAAKECRRPHC